MRARWAAVGGCILVLACNDGVIAPGADSHATDTGSADTRDATSAPADGTTADSTTVETATEETAATETTPSDTAVPDSTPSDTTATETTPSDSAVTETPPSDTAAPDSTPSDTHGDGDTDSDTTQPPACGTAPAWIGQVQIVRNGRYANLSGLPAGNVPARDVTVYLPANYDSESAARFPVMYMHDGQNLFDDVFSAFGEWGVDEAVDALTASGDIGPLMIVGVPNNADRVGEYTPSEDPIEGGGRGADYVRWLVEAVKPAIDASFRTACARESTAVMGSSLGGLISLWMATEAPANQLFGRFGVVSPSLWWDGEALLEAIETGTLPRPTRLWLDMGTAEAELGWTADDAVERSQRLRNRLLALGLELGTDFGYLEDVGAAHDEHAWRARLPAILRSLWGAPMTGKPSGLQILPWHDGLYLGPRPTMGVSVEAAYDPSGRLTIAAASAQLATTDGGVTSLEGDRIRGLQAGAGSLSAAYLGAAALGAVTVHGAGLVPLRFFVHVPAFTDRVYVAGDASALGPWNPGLVSLAIVPPLGSDLWTVEVPVAAGVEVKYKYTRGTWESVEVHADGTDLGDRVVAPPAGETVVRDTVDRWRDF